VFHGESCFGEFDLLHVAASNDANTKTLTVGFFLNSEISGDVNYQYIDEDNSIVSYANLDPATQTITTTGLPFYELVVGGNSARTIDLTNLNFVFGPGDSLLIAVKVSSSPVSGLVSINWYEQQ
jgi:hypothetical protein